MMDLSGSVVLITGAAKRVGRAIALTLADAGCDVAVHYRTSREAAKTTASEIERRGVRALLLEADLTDPDAPRRLIEETVSGLGGLDILVNNASIFEVPGESIEVFDLAQWERLMSVNLMAPAALCHHARAHLASGGHGVIINLCDIASRRPWANALGYCVTKAALEALTLGMARALAPKIRVNGVAPGIAVFPEHYDPDQRARLVAKVPMQRSGTPADIAKAVRFLCESADYVTGQILAVDGGRSLR